jgi:hypothetical protein
MARGAVTMSFDLDAWYEDMRKLKPRFDSLRANNVVWSEDFETQVEYEEAVAAGGMPYEVWLEAWEQER